MSRRARRALILLACAGGCRTATRAPTPPPSAPATTTVAAPAPAAPRRWHAVPAPVAEDTIAAAIAGEVGLEVSILAQQWVADDDGITVGYVVHRRDAYEACRAEGDASSCDQPMWDDAPLHGCYEHGLATVHVAPDGTVSATDGRLPRGGCKVEVRTLEAVDVDADDALELHLVVDWSVAFFGPMGQEGDPDPTNGYDEYGGVALAVLRMDGSVELVHDVELLPRNDWAQAYTIGYHWGRHELRRVDGDRHPDLVLHRADYDATYEGCPEDADGWPTASDDPDAACAVRAEHVVAYDPKTDTWPIPKALQRR